MTLLFTPSTSSLLDVVPNRNRMSPAALADGGEHTGDSDNGPIASETLIRRNNSLDLPELQSLLSYIQQCIEAVRTPIEKVIKANAAGVVPEIEKHGADALVRKHPPVPGGPRINTDIVSLYHVRRKSQLDGTDSLHWPYLGIFHDAGQIRCDSPDSIDCTRVCTPGASHTTKVSTYE